MTPHIGPWRIKWEEGIPLTMRERKILRKTNGPTYINGYWRTKMQQGIYKKFKTPDIVTVAI